MDARGPFLVLLLVVGVVLIVTVALIRRGRRSGSLARRARARRARAQARVRSRQVRHEGPAYLRVQVLAQAAAESDEELRRQLTTVDVNVRTPEGDSALHLAHHAGQREAVERLERCGADATLRNDEGLTPVEMAELADVERLVEKTARCLSGNIWVNVTVARPLYDELRAASRRLYNPALVRVFLRTPHQRRLLCLAVKVGMPGSEHRLALILQGYGDREMATDYLNCGSAELVHAAEQWAAAHGYVIHHRSGGTVARWGRF